MRMGFGRTDLAMLTGVLVMATGVVSAATLAVATIGFLNDLGDVSVNENLGIIVLVVAMGLVAAWAWARPCGWWR